MKTLKPTVLALVCGVLLTLANQQMRAVIGDNQRDFEQRILRDMIGGDRLEPAAGGWRIVRDGDTRGYIETATTNKGYNGTIELFVARDIDGRIISVRTKHHQETPGIGDRIELGVSNWILGFNDRTVQTLDQVDSISGATITSRAVTGAVQGALPP